MKTSAISLLKALAFCLLLLTHNLFAQDPNFHIYLCFGQSNMEGMGPIETQDRTTDARVKVLADQTCTNLSRVYGQWYVASPPLNRCWNGIGPADYFGKTMANNTPSNITIGLVPAAYSGCDIAFYQKSAPLGKASTTGGANADIPTQFTGGYAWLLDLAKKAQTAGVIKGIIFHQGETNTGDPNWKYKVQEIVGNLRQDLGIGNVPFLAGELLYAQNGGCCSSHNVEVNKLPGIIPNAHVISAAGLTNLTGSDAHFSTASYRTFGERYADEMLALENTVTATNGAAGSEGNISIFPVPCKESLTVNVSGFLEKLALTVRIYSLDGKLVSEKVFDSGSLLNILTSGLKADLYVLKISGQDFEVQRIFSKID